MSVMNGGTGWGNENSGAPFPPLTAIEGAFAEVELWDVQRHRGGMSLIERRLPQQPGAASFAARGAGSSRREQTSRQPGRERPYFGCPRLRPKASPDRVAHAPAACLVYPDKRDRALVIDTTQCLVAQRDARSSRTGPRDGCPPSQHFPDRRVLCH
jgi:hypothetical protein